MESRIAPAVAAIDDFERSFGIKPSALVRAPGRVNVIGEHTDYNGGFVLPMAIDRAVWIALRPRDDSRVCLHASLTGETHKFDLSALPTQRGAADHWTEYAHGVAQVLVREDLSLRGFDGWIGSDLPVGAGLSSSAALQLAVARAFFLSSDLPWDPIVTAQRVQRAENEWVGVQCGIMDPLVCAAGIADSALLIDCRDLGLSTVPIPPDVTFVILDSTTRRRLVDSDYNMRRRECERAVSSLGGRSLRDLSLAELEQAYRGESLDPISFRRARHVITENQRTLLAAEALAKADLPQLGELLLASHRSLRDDFEVSNAVLDVLVDVSCEHDSCFGARLTGAGFGGCVIAAVEPNDSGEFVKRAKAAFSDRTGLELVAFPTRATAGAMELDITRYV